MIIQENGYKDYMDKTVAPYLEERMEVEYSERIPGQKQYCEYFTADDPKGIVVVSHGFTETAEKFHEVVYYFVTGGYDVCIVEHCGHGRSYRLVENDLSLVHVDRFERYVEDLHFVAEHVKKKWPGLPMYLYGHSMGGGIAAAIAGKYPDLFEKVVLNAPMIRPLTGGVPWSLAKFISRIMCMIGKSEKYVTGQGRFVSGQETYESSPDNCRERFDYYQDKREKESLFQMNGASYGWLREAGRLNRYLMKEGYRDIRAKVLLLQAENDTFVSDSEQNRYILKINEYRGEKESARLISFTGLKHELYFSDSDVLERYWGEILSFYG